MSFKETLIPKDNLPLLFRQMRKMSEQVNEISQIPISVECTPWPKKLKTISTNDVLLGTDMA